MNKLFSIILVTCFLTSCNAQTGKKSPLNDDKVCQTIEKNDSILILEHIRGDKDAESLNLLLSQICKKDKIDISNWNTKYSEYDMLSYEWYIKYRLTVLYGINFRGIEPDEEMRLRFFIASVGNNDYEILNLLDFEDDALDGNSCYGITVLTAAVRENNVKMVKYLLGCGVDRNKREFPACYDDAQDGQNAYEIAESLGYKEIMLLLK